MLPMGWYVVSMSARTGAASVPSETERSDACTVRLESVDTVVVAASTGTTGLYATVRPH